MTATPSLWIAFVAGLLSFFSPCALPLYPSYISYISGVSFVGEPGSKTRSARSRAMTHTIFFVLGFSIIFVMLGYGASLIGQVLLQYRDAIRIVGGILVMLMGLYMVGLLKFGFLSREQRVRVPAKRASYLGAVLVGISFAAGWTPCIGPILASVLVLAATHPGLGSTLMVAYSLGFAAPFLVLAATLGSVRWFMKYSERVSAVGGAIMILMGFLLVTDYISAVSDFLVRTFGAGI